MIAVGKDSPIDQQVQVRVIIEQWDEWNSMRCMTSYFMKKKYIPTRMMYDSFIKFSSQYIDLYSAGKTERI